MDSSPRQLLAGEANFIQVFQEKCCLSWNLGHVELAKKQKVFQAKRTARESLEVRCGRR